MPQLRPEATAAEKKTHKSDVAKLHAELKSSICLTRKEGDAASAKVIEADKKL